MIHEGRSRREILHEALEAARAEHHVQAQRCEAARAQLQAIAKWIETGRPQREILHGSAVARLRARLDSLPVIEQAKGILMAQQRCGPEEAFDCCAGRPSGPTSRCTCWRHKSSPKSPHPQLRPALSPHPLAVTGPVPLRPELIGQTGASFDPGHGDLHPSIGPPTRSLLTRVGHNADGGC